MPDLYWIEQDVTAPLAIAERPRGGDVLLDDVQSWKNAGVDVAASLLTEEEIEELDLEEEARLCWQAGIDFLRCPFRIDPFPTT